MANAVQIQAMNALYSVVARTLNDRENHRTDTQYEDALIGKTFLFQVRVARACTLRACCVPAARCCALLRAAVERAGGRVRARMRRAYMTRIRRA